MSCLGSFLDPQTIDSMSKVNRKAYDGSLNENCTSHIQAIKDNKANIVAKTDAHIAARETIETIINNYR